MYFYALFYLLFYYKSILSATFCTFADVRSETSGIFLYTEKDPVCKAAWVFQYKTRQSKSIRRLQYFIVKILSNREILHFPVQISRSNMQRLCSLSNPVAFHFCFVHQLIDTEISRQHIFAACSCVTAAISTAISFTFVICLVSSFNALPESSAIFIIE